MVPECPHTGFYRILLEPRTTQVVVTTGAIRCAKFQSNYHHQHTNTQLFAGLKPFLSPNQQCHSTEGKCIKRFCLTNKNLCQPTQKCLLTFGQLHQAIVKAATGNAKLLTDTSADKILQCNSNVPASKLSAQTAYCAWGRDISCYVYIAAG